MQQRVWGLPPAPPKREGSQSAQQNSNKFGSACALHHTCLQKTKREKDRSSDSKVTKTDNKLIRYEKTTNHDNESSWRDGESVLCQL